MNKPSTEKRTHVVRCLVDGNSIRATVRITGVARNTITNILVDLGHAREAYQYRTLHNLTCKRLQVDEIWALCHSKEKNVAPEHEGIVGHGGVRRFMALDAETEFVPTWLIGERNGSWTTAFMPDLQRRLSHQVQLTTDSHKMDLEAV